MSTIKSSAENLTLNADGANNDIKFQSNGSEVASIDQAGSLVLSGNLTSLGIDDNADATAITIDSSENVGIGVVPEAWGSSYKALQIGDKTSLTDASDRSRHMNNVYEDTSANMLRLSTSLGAVRYEQYDGEHIFKVAGTGTGDISWTTGMTIENNGSVLIKSFRTSGSATGIKIDTSAGSQTPILSSASSTATRTHMTFVNPNGEVGFIKTTNSGTAFATSSDYRLKENVDYTWDATTRLKQLKPARFNFIADNTITVDGFLAHEAATVVPESVTGTKDAMKDEEYEVTPAVMDGDTVVTEAVMGTRSVPDMQGIDQSKLVPLLVKTIQELEARITALEA